MGQVRDKAVGAAALVCEMIPQAPDPSPRLVTRRSWLLQDAVEWSDPCFSHLLHLAPIVAFCFLQAAISSFCCVPRNLCKHPPANCDPCSRVYFLEIS